MNTADIVRPQDTDYTEGYNDGQQERQGIREAAQRVVDEMGRAPQDTKIPANLGLALLGLRLEVERDG